MGGNSLRVKQVQGTTTKVYIASGTSTIAEYTNGVLTREHIYLGSQLLATEEGATTRYHHYDHLSIRLTTDSTGTTIATHGHYPYGEPIVSHKRSGTLAPRLFLPFSMMTTYSIVPPPSGLQSSSLQNAIQT